MLRSLNTELGYCLTVSSILVLRLISDAELRIHNVYFFHSSMAFDKTEPLNTLVSEFSSEVFVEDGV